MIETRKKLSVLLLGVCYWWSCTIFHFGALKWLNFQIELLIWDHCVSLTFARNGWVGKFLPFTRMYSNFFISASLLRLKVGKSQKWFFLLSILTKNEQKILPNFALASKNESCLTDKAPNYYKNVPLISILFDFTLFWG